MASAPLPFSREEVQALYTACGRDPAGKHDVALLAVLLNCGLSISEAAALRWLHLDEERRWLRIAASGQRPRFLPLNHRVLAALQEWRQVAPGWPFVFGRWPLSARMWTVRFSHRKRSAVLEKRLADLGRQAGIPVTAERTALTLVNELLDLSEEGREIRSLIPPDKQTQIRLPVANMSPFSAAARHTGMAVVARGFIPSPFDFLAPPAEDEIIRQGRRLLDQVGSHL